MGAGALTCRRARIRGSPGVVRERGPCNGHRRKLPLNPRRGRAVPKGGLRPVTESHRAPWPRRPTGRSGLRCSGRANHQDQVTPPHLPGGKPGSGPPPGGKFQQRIDMGEPARERQTKPNRREILREHRAARESRRNPAAVSTSPSTSMSSEQRRLLRELTPAQPLPADVTVTAAALGGVPTAEITLDGIEPHHIVLYFHGGVYVMGDAFLAADLASQVGRRTRAKVISVDYRLAPEHPYPAAVDDALAAYEALLHNGTAPSDIVFAGESAGGGLAVATLVNARDHGLPLPAAAFVMSPYADLTLAGTTMETKREADPLISRELLQSRVTDYTAGQDAALRPHQPDIRRSVRPAAPDHPGRNARSSPRRRRPPRAASRHRRRRGHPRHHPWGAARLPGLLSDPRRSGRCTGQSRTAPVGASRRRRTRHRIAKGRSQGEAPIHPGRTGTGRRRSARFSRATRAHGRHHLASRIRAIVATPAVAGPIGQINITSGRIAFTAVRLPCGLLKGRVIHLPARYRSHATVGSPSGGPRSRRCHD